MPNVGAMPSYWIMWGFQMTTNHVAIVLALFDIAVVIGLCIYGDYISAVGMTVLGILCIVGGLLGQTSSGRTMDASA